jgi:protein TonB
MFEHYIAGTKASWKRRALVIASIAVHAVVAAGLLIWSVLHVEEIAPPAVSLTFFSAPPPPPPPPPPAGRKAVEHKPRPTPKVLQQPTEVPKLVQPPEPKEEEEEGEEGGVEGGVAGGVAGGTVGGVIGGVLQEKPPAPPPAPKLVPSFVLDGQRLSSPDPHLPEAFIQQHARGEQIRGTYRICISPDGRVSDVTVVTPIPGADSAVIEQLKATWRYKPQPIPVCNIRNFIFKLR